MRRQGGWVGMVALLIALAVVALLAQSALKRYGLMPAGETRSAARDRGEPAPTAGADAAGVTSATPSFRAPVERARGVEATILQGAAERARAVEAQSR